MRIIKLCPRITIGWFYRPYYLLALLLKSDPNCAGVGIGLQYWCLFLKFSFPGTWRQLIEVPHSEWDYLPTPRPDAKNYCGPTWTKHKGRNWEFNFYSTSINDSPSIWNSFSVSMSKNNPACIFAILKAKTLLLCWLHALFVMDMNWFGKGSQIWEW